MMKKIYNYLIPNEENDYRPGLFQGLSAFLILFVVLGVLIAGSVTTVVVDRDGLLGAIYTSVLVDLTNEARLENGLEPLRLSSELAQIASLKAEHMAENEYFAHNSPEGVSPWYWFGAVGYDFVYAGENLAVDFDDSEDVNDAWLDSPGHRANILDARFTEIGIATFEGEYNGHNTVYVVQMFGTPAPVPEVASEQVEKKTEPEVTVVQQEETEQEKYIVVERSDVVDEVVPEEEVDEIDEELQEETVLESQAPGYEEYTTWYEWILLNPTKVAEYILYTISLLIALAFLGMILIHHRVQRPRNIVYGALLLLSILASIYANETKMIVDAILGVF